MRSPYTRISWNGELMTVSRTVVRRHHLGQRPRVSGFEKMLPRFARRDKHAVRVPMARRERPRKRQRLRRIFLQIELDELAIAEALVRSTRLTASELVGFPHMCFP